MNKGEIMKKVAVLLATISLLVFGTSPAHAETDPFPGVDHMAEIPGTRISSPAGSTQAEFDASDAVRNFSCPAGAGSAMEVAVGVRIWSYYCIKTWRSQAVIDAWANYYKTLESAQQKAFEQSLAWNQANPGLQKCFQWGPITSPDGGVSSGGVCANPVEASAAPSGTVSREEAESFESTQAVSRVSAFLNSFDAIPSVTKKSRVMLPKLKSSKKLGLSIRLKTNNSAVCQISKSTLRFVSSGKCRVRVVISDKSGNTVSSLLRIEQAKRLT